MATRKTPARSGGAAYILIGPELGKKQIAIQEIKKEMANNTVCEETVFYAGETPVNQIVFEIQNQSLFAQSRLFLIKNAELIKKKDEIDSLDTCVRELDDGTVLILISEETRLAAGLDNLVPKEKRRVFYELFESEKNEWVRDFFTQHGFRIDADGIETVLELVENNTEALARDCSRLMHFLRDPQKTEQAQTVSADDIERWLSHNREESAFTLFSRIAAGDFPKALESLKAILAEKKFQDRTAQIMLAGIASCFRKLRSYHALLKSGQTGTYELKSIGISAPGSRADYASASRRYTADATDACLALTSEYDLLLRTMGNSFESILLDTWLVKIYELTIKN